jgi:hypothetical protein
MPEIYSKPYRPIGEATFGHRVFLEKIILPADLGVGVAYTDNDLVINFQGFARQAWKVLVINGGAGPTANVEIQEFMPDPGMPNDGDAPTNGQWATKGSLGVGVATADILFEHNQEDTLRLTRLVITPVGSLPATGIKVVIEGRRDT